MTGMMLNDDGNDVEQLFEDEFDDETSEDEVEKEDS